MYWYSNDPALREPAERGGSGRLSNLADFARKRGTNYVFIQPPARLPGILLRLGPPGQNSSLVS